MAPILQFLGAARTVTGSKFLLYANGHEVLVDAGLFQGSKELRRRNWDRMPVDPRNIDAVVLTHGHIDHVGYLPRLLRQGFSGPIFCSSATKDLLAIMLPDSARIQEEEARYANLKGYSKHDPALPLYTEQDARDALENVHPLPYGVPAEIVTGIRATLHPSGHILGAAFVELAAEGVRTVFSGDIGGYDDEVMKAPAPLPPDVDYVLVEATYGGRSEDHAPVRDQIERHAKPVLERGGMIVIPAFAVGRTTLVLYHLRRLIDEKRLPDVPVFVDSPMATTAVELYCDHSGEHNLRTDLLKSSACPIVTPNIHLIRTVEQSKRLNDVRGPGVIISASGMATGGRVLHHLRRRLPDPANLVLVVGYQAEGTRGRQLVDGADEVRIMGAFVRVRARVASIRGLSAHGDCDDILRWLKTATRPPRRTFLVHGETDGLNAMAKRIDAEVGFPHSTPEYLQTVTLET